MYCVKPQLDLESRCVTFVDEDERGYVRGKGLSDPVGAQSHRLSKHE